MGQAQTTSAPDGRTLCYAEYGDLGGHPVISLHGTPGCRLLWARAVAGNLESVLRSLRVRLIRYDRPGYGGSARRAGRSVADSADDVEAVADALGLPRFAVEGGFGGAPHALAAAALLPERVERVAVVCPASHLRGVEDEQVVAHRLAEQDAARREAAAGDDAAAAVFEATRPGLWGWVDDELALGAPWGFDLAEVRVRTRIYDRGDWLAGSLPHAELIEGAEPDALYGWLATG